MYNMKKYLFIILVFIFSLNYNIIIDAGHLCIDKLNDQNSLNVIALSNTIADHVEHIINESIGMTNQIELEKQEIKRQEQIINQINNITYSEDDVTIISNMTIEQFNIILQDTWLKNQGELFYILEQTYNINGIFAISVSIHEVGWDITKSRKAYLHNNIFGISVGNQEFESYGDCVNYFGNFINRLYIDKNIKSVANISKKYCDPPEHWEYSVKNLMRDFYFIVNTNIKNKINF